MSTLTIEKKNALIAYEKTGDEGKEILSNLFGPEVFSQKITDRIKTWEDVCAEVGENPNGSYYTDEGHDDPQFREIEPHELAYRKLILIAKVLNEGWKPNWNNSNQYKWHPWFYMNQPGFRFLISVRYYDGAAAGAGSRLCFSSRELSDYAGNAFFEIYKQLMTNGD